jgi:hypothetical protein
MACFDLPLLPLQVETSRSGSAQQDDERGVAVRLRSGLTRGLAVAGLVLTSSMLAPIPAQAAATGYNRCPANRMCVFSGVNGTGTIGYFTAGDANLGDATGPRGLNNTIESVWDRRGDEWCLYNDAGYRGGITLVYSGAKTNIAAAYRNITSSLLSCRA